MSVKRTLRQPDSESETPEALIKSHQSAPDSEKTDPLADDADGFDRDVRTLFVAQVLLHDCLCVVLCINKNEEPTNRLLYVCVHVSMYTFKNPARKQVARKVNERDLFTFFSEWGKVQDVRIIEDTQSRKSKGIAYVEFEKQEQVVVALAKSGQTLCGFPIVVQASQAEKNQFKAMLCVYTNNIHKTQILRVKPLATGHVE
jgi:hypothetical protein